MMEKKLQILIDEASDIRRKNIENDSANYYDEVFFELSTFILKKLKNPLFKNKNAKIIAEHFDEIFPYINQSNHDKIFSHINLLLKQPNFKEKFVIGLSKYPYKNEIREIIYCICSEIDDKNIYNNLIAASLEVLSNMELTGNDYAQILNKINEENQRKLLNLLVKNKCDISYKLIEYEGNNKQIIYDNLQFIIENSKGLYRLMDFVSDNPSALSQVKEYLDNNEEKALNSIFYNIEKIYSINKIKIGNPKLKQMIKIIVKEVIQNENVKFSDINFASGGFSSVLLIGNKVIKIGNRKTKSFPNNPYIIAPLLRQEIETNGESYFMEITERVDTSTIIDYEELYQLFKNLRNLGLVWTDIKGSNVGRLKKENIIHWNEDLSPSEEVLGFKTKRGNQTLKEGDLVILDADFIYEEGEQNITYPKDTCFCEFEKRYQEEKKKEKSIKINLSERNYEQAENKGLYR